jgi:hypothetical protein
MSAFVRKNLLVATAVFTAANGNNALEPSSATLVVNYNDISGVNRTTSIAMTFNAASDDWVGTWDTSVAQQGNVEWLIYGVGTLQAAAQGQFQIQANAANTV